MTDLFPREILFPVIRAGMNLESPDLQIADQDFSILYKIGKKQSLIPIIRTGLKQCGYVSDTEKYLEQEYMKSMYQFVQHDQALKELGEVFEKCGIEYLPLKGSVLRDLYPEPWMRTSVDIDILIHEEDLEKAIEEIEKATSFCFLKRNYHDVSMTNDKVHFELHFSIKENMDNIDRLLSEVWSYAYKNEDSYLFRMTPEYQIFHTIAHMYYHMCSGGLGIRPFIDLWLLRNKTAYDEKTVRSMCSDCGILTFYEKSCDLSDSWFSRKDYSEDSELLETYCLNGGVFDFGEDTGAVKGRDHSKISYIGKRIIANRSMLEEEYPELKSKSYLAPYYQVKRWTRLFDRKTRNHALSEMSRIRNTDEEQSKRMKEFLKRLGI